MLSSKWSFNECSSPCPPIRWSYYYTSLASLSFSAAIEGGTWPASEALVQCYLASLRDFGFAPRTMVIHLAAMSFYSKPLGFSKPWILTSHSKLPRAFQMEHTKVINKIYKYINQIHENSSSVNTHHFHFSISGMPSCCMVQASACIECNMHGTFGRLNCMGP